MRSRRNLLDEIDASTLRFVRSRTRRTGARHVARAIRPAGRPRPLARVFRSTPIDENVTASAICPLTDGRHVCRAQWSGDESVWACHNEREEDRSGSPRESRVTVALWAARVKDVSNPPGGNRGGDEGTRTPDPLLAKEVLSQLSYIPTGARIVSATGTAVKAPQRKTTVRSPWSRTRCSTCQRTARASATHSTSRPTRASSSTLWAWSTRATSCSMIGPSSSCSVT